jgi:hypothetical protein
MRMRIPNLTILKRPWTMLFFALCVLGLVAAFFWMRSSGEVTRALESYQALSRAHEEAAYLPGIPENPVRERVNAILSDVLARPMEPAERLARAQEGLSVLKDAEVQIDAIGDVGEKVQIAIAYFEEKSGPVSFVRSSEAEALVAVAKEEFGIIADIRGLSYRANFHTAEIFNRIVLDKGELSAAYIADLNKELPLVEEQFNARTMLYGKLKDVRARVEVAIRDMGGRVE